MSLPHDAMIARIATLLGQGRSVEAERELAAIRRDLPVQQATTVLNQLLQQHTNWVPALDELGRCMLQMQQHRAAFNIGAHITQLDGDDARGLELQALAMEQGGATAIEVLPLRRRLVALQPDSLSYQFLLAVTASRVGYYREMHAALDATLALDPSHLFARWAKFLTPRGKFFASDDEVQRFIADWDSGCAAFAGIDLEAPDARPQLEHLLLAQSNFHLAYTGIDVTSRQIALGQVLRRIARSALPQFDRPFAARPASGKLRVGFLTASLRHHTVLKLFGGLMRGLPRQRFEVHAYALEAGVDAVTEQLRRELDLVRTELTGLGTMAQRIRDDACDALIYLDIGMHPRTVALSALRLAPFQAMLWGHPVTSGVDTIDAFISSALMEPVDAQAHYSEALLTLPGLGCWFDPQTRSPTPPRPKNDDDRVRLCCAQNGLKLLPEQDGVFARILAAAPAADLTLLCGLHAGIEQDLVARMRPGFLAHGVDFERRVHVVGNIDEAGFQQELAQADLVLDSLHWSGGVTALETFSADTPILTLPGAFMRGRHTFAMLQLLELPELITDDVDDFVRRAVALASDPAERMRLRALVSARKSRLYRDHRVVTAFTELLQREVAKRTV
jgi:protein O-GlcNAc transferase